MAEAFSPRFVDLVRNTITSVGTGNFTLGPAAAGFTSFAAAVQPGESFYYSCIAASKAESEVGRGTMQADGTISRDPINGTLTDFTAGPKTVALIAAAEWFEKVDQAGGGSSSPVDVPDRAALAASGAQSGAARLLAERGFEGLFSFDSSDLSAKVAADPQQGIFVAPVADRTGASGAWVRRNIDFLRPEWFGVVPNVPAAADGNDSAWAAMMSAAGAIGMTYFGFNGCATILFDAKAYYFGSTLELKHSVHLKGRGNGMAGGMIGTRLHFPPDTCGIRVNRIDTLGESGPTTPTTSADGTIIDGFYIEGSSTVADQKKAGIHMRARAIVKGCWITGFGGAGVLVWGSTSASDWTSGNTNNWRVENCTLRSNKFNGLEVRGADANAGVSILVDASGNAGYGICDRSFLGNTHIAPHTDSNGVHTAGGGLNQTAFVSDGTWRYQLADGQDANALTTPPTTGASNAVWLLSGPGGPSGTIPLYSGYAGAFVSGGSYFIGGTNARSAVIGLYTESNQPNPIIVAPSVAWGGFNSSSAADFGNQTSATTTAGITNSIGFAKRAQNPNGGRVFEAGIGSNDVETVLRFVDTQYAPLGWKIRQGINALLPADLHTAYGSTVVERLTGPSTTEQFGTGAAQPLHRHIVSLAVGPMSFGRKITNDTAAPASGPHAQGEIAFNRSASAGGNAGWICTAAGSPGTWRKIPGQANAPSVTYAAPPGASYVAPAGGATVDSEGRASLAQLAADSAAIRTSLLALAADNADLRTKLAASGATA